MNRSVADFSDPSAFRTYVLDASWLQPLLNAGPCKSKGSQAGSSEFPTRSILARKPLIDLRNQPERDTLIAIFLK